MTDAATPPTPPETAAPARTGALAPPLGLRGLPRTIEVLDAYEGALCSRLRSAGGHLVPGKRLFLELQLEDARALRLLVAFAHVHRRRWQIVGVPGSGYCWGPDNPEAVKTMIAHARRMGRCWLHSSALYRGGDVAATAAGWLFDWMAEPSAVSGTPDELGAMVAAEGGGIGDVLEHLVTRLSASEDGRRTLQDLGRRHGDVLIPSAALDDVLAGLDGVRRSLLQATRARPPASRPPYPDTAASDPAPLPPAQSTRIARAKSAQSPP